MIEVRYLEILETRDGEADMLFLRGKREDLETLVQHLPIDTNERNKLTDAANSSYVEIKHTCMSFDKAERLRLAELLSGYGWTLKTSSFSCVTKRVIEFIYRDLWEK